MNRKCLFLLLGLVLSLNLAACAKAEPENPYRLKTKSYITYYDAEDEETIFSYFYDEQNRVIRSEKSNGDVTTHTYDNYGNLIRSETHGPSGTDVTTEYILTLDKKHRPIRSEFYWNSVHRSTTVYTYNSQGHETQLDISRYTEDTTICSQVIREYDRQGNLLREETIYSDGSSYTIYEYENGHLCRTASYGAADDLQSYTAILWDEATQTQTQKSYLGDGTNGGHFIRYYDEFGNCLKEKFYAGPNDPLGGGDDVLDRMVTYTYERIPE